MKDSVIAELEKSSHSDNNMQGPATFAPKLSKEEKEEIERLFEISN